MTAHIAKIHQGGKGNFSCTECDSKFDSNAELTEHTSSVHKPIKVSSPKKSGKVDKKGKVKGRKSEQPLDKNMDIETVSQTEYVLPESIDVSVNRKAKQSSPNNAKSLETFIKEAVSTEENDKVNRKSTDQRLENEQMQSIIGSAASRAMEVLYSSDAS